jgi:hypothetical protein
MKFEPLPTDKTVKTTTAYANTKEGKALAAKEFDLTPAQVAQLNTYGPDFNQFALHRNEDGSITLEPKTHEKPASIRVSTGSGGDDKGLTLPETDALTDALQVKKKAGRLKSGFSSAYIPRVGQLTASDTLADVENKIMATTGNNPQASAWWRDFWDTFNSEAYKKSGKAISEAEMKRLLKAWATGSSDPKVMQDFIGVKEAEIDEYYRSRKAGISTGKRKAVETWEKEIAPKTDPLGIL